MALLGRLPGNIVRGNCTKIPRPVARTGDFLKRLKNAEIKRCRRRGWP